MRSYMGVVRTGQAGDGGGLAPGVDAAVLVVKICHSYMRI
jgi:hypothetical protein